MKTILVLFALVAAVVAQKEPWCRCGIFINFSDHQELVYTLENIIIDDCVASAETCKTSCAAEINEFTNDGDLWSLASSGETVGQEICTKMAAAEHHSHHYIHNRNVYGYFGLCAGPWEYADVKSQQMLCCEDGVHAHCHN
ncbi:uncharacterized protein [Palaemon carinicauda]|uniref:uncharacterized protein n=1 Tax=Palaemon carinicauda TaxID=392227 RepID=UPI0035B5D35C